MPFALGAAALALLALLILAAPRADAGAIIDNGVVQIGVADSGNLIVPGGTPASTGVTAVGIRFMANNNEGTADGCWCEGWGAYYVDPSGATEGHANGAFSGGITGSALVATANTAVSTAAIGALQITHDFHPSASPNLYEATVTVSNSGSSTITGITYRRVMDWDVEPTPFNEYVTIQTAATVPAELIASSNDGFLTGNPSEAIGAYWLPGPPAATLVDSGPRDQGTSMDFALGTLAPGDSVSFDLYFGAAPDEATADAAIAAVGAQAWSYGQASTTDGPSLGTPNTFILGVAFSTGGAPGACKGLVPPAPSGLAATAGTSIALSWTPPSAKKKCPILDQTIQRQSGASGFVTIATVSGTATAYADATAYGCHTNTYRVIARNAVGPSVASASATAAGPTIAPNAPTGLTATTSTTTPPTTILTWTTGPDNGCPAASYTVQRDGVAIATVTTTTYTDSSALPCVSYLYTIVANNPYGASPPSVAVSHKIQPLGLPC